jgi:hypothetical protein
MYVFSLFFLCCDIDQFIFVSQWVANSLSLRKACQRLEICGIQD